MEDRGVLSAFNNVRTVEEGMKKTRHGIINNDPRYKDYQLIMNAFGLSTLAICTAVPVDLLVRPTSEVKLSLSCLFYNSEARKEALVLFRSIVLHSTFKHALLLYSYEKAKYYISSDTAINGLLEFEILEYRIYLFKF